MEELLLSPLAVVFSPPGVDAPAPYVEFKFDPGVPAASVDVPRAVVEALRGSEVEG